MESKRSSFVCGFCPNLNQDVTGHPWKCWSPAFWKWVLPGMVVTRQQNGKAQVKDPVCWFRKMVSGCKMLKKTQTGFFLSISQSTLIMGFLFSIIFRIHLTKTRKIAMGLDLFGVHCRHPITQKGSLGSKCHGFFFHKIQGGGIWILLPRLHLLRRIIWYIRLSVDPTSQSSQQQPVRAPVMKLLEQQHWIIVWSHQHRWGPWGNVRGAILVKRYPPWRAYQADERIDGGKQLPSSVARKVFGAMINQDVHGSGDRHRSFPGGTPPTRWADPI